MSSTPMTISSRLRKRRSFLSGVYNVFEVDASISSMSTIMVLQPCRHPSGPQKNGFGIFAKPILYAEVGYSGNGGQDQIAVGPATSRSIRNCGAA